MEVNLKRFGFPGRMGVEAEDDGVVELSLDLSIGRGSYRMAPTDGTAHQMRDPDVGSGAVEADHGGSGASVSSSSPPPPLAPFQRGELVDGLDPQRRREMHALRRQEARKKRHEKQQKKGLCEGGRNGAASVVPGGPGFYHGLSPPRERTCSLDDRVLLEAQEQRSRVRDREAREEETRHSERRAVENHDPGSDFAPVPELSLNADANPNAGANPNPCFSPKFSNPNLAPFGAHAFPVMAMQYPYHHLQYVPMANGFGFPYMVPCWAPPMSSVAGVPNLAANVFQPVACRTFSPFSVPPVAEPSANEASPLNSKVVDSSAANVTEIKRAPSWTCSLGSNSSSAISDHQSNSLQGGSSSGGGGGDIRSHSNHDPSERSHRRLSPQVSNLVQGQSEHSISSRRLEPEANAVEDSSEKRTSSDSTPSCAKEDSNPAKLEVTVSVDKPTAAADESIPPPLVPSPLPRMPCVSATGNGPDGKTITGFLYRYTSTEVSIVCVCHGSSFTPAEFVKHAGGTGVANPLKHITVVPS